jgi:hypothetical protein
MHALLLAAATLAADITPPKVLDDRLQLQLVAAEPEVVTPTGLAVDERGRVLVIESHTHFPLEGYKGPKHDRILILDDFDPATGKARKIGVFFEGTTHTMNLAVYHDGSIYVATRAEIFRLRDVNHDGKADGLTRICHLETAGNYPHNGLSGFAFNFAGNVYFGFGENLGADYKLIGSDGKSLAGGGEGGNIYCCDFEGKNLRRVATGIPSTSVSTRSADCLPSITIPTAGRRAVSCTSWKGATTATASATAARACIPSRPGMASFPARCRWSPARAKPPAACWPTSPTTCPRNTAATCS